MHAAVTHWQHSGYPVTTQWLIREYRNDTMPHPLFQVQKMHSAMWKVTNRGVLRLVGHTRAVEQLDASKNKHGHVGDHTSQESDRPAVAAYSLGRTNIDEVVEHARGQVDECGSVERAGGQAGEVAGDLGRISTPISASLRSLDGWQTRRLTMALANRGRCVKPFSLAASER